jgi:hypothetical protein
MQLIFACLQVQPTLSSLQGKQQPSLPKAGLPQSGATIKYDMLIKVSLMQL